MQIEKRQPRRKYKRREITDKHRIREQKRRLLNSNHREKRQNTVTRYKMDEKFKLTIARVQWVQNNQSVKKSFQ